MLIGGRSLSAILVVGALGLAGCGSTTTIVKTVTEPAKQEPVARRAAAPAPESGDAELGDLLTLRGESSTLKVRVTDLIDPLPTGEYDEPEPGKRYVGVKFVVKNIGPKSYADALGNGATLIVRGNQQVGSTIVTSGPCGGNFQSDVKIAAADKRSGCIPFEVPVRKRVRSFQFTPNSGFADVTAEWDLRDAEPAAASAPSAPAPRSTTQSATPVVEGGWTRCDQNISARVGSTSCPFASNVFYEYWVGGQRSAVIAYSPATSTSYSVACLPSGTRVTCTAEDGGAVTFPQAAVDAYSQSQATAYAATHDIG